MAEWTGSKLDGIEARATAVVAVGLTNSLSPVVIVKMAEESLEVIAELRRLQGIEDRLKDLMTHKRERIAKDRKIAQEQGDSWLGINTHTVSANLLDRELQNLERVLGND